MSQQQQQPVGYYPQPVYLTDEQANALKSISDSVTVIRQCVYVLAIFVVGAIVIGALVGMLSLAS